MKKISLLMVLGCALAFCAILFATFGATASWVEMSATGKTCWAKEKLEV